MKLPNSTHIAGVRTVADWVALRGHLTGSSDPAAWTVAFEGFFKERLENRYFAPVRTLENMASDVGEGFAIVTIHCSLIEFLAATLEGKSYRLLKRGDPPINEEAEYSNSKEMFVRFLKCRSPFSKMFSGDQAEDFYTSVRCGLFHEARTKGAWRIRVCDSAISAIDAEAKVVYRNKMQNTFDQFVEWYGQQICTNETLQQAFIRKFDSLCEE